MSQLHLIYMSRHTCSNITNKRILAKPMTKRLNSKGRPLTSINLDNNKMKGAKNEVVAVCRGS